VELGIAIKLYAQIAELGSTSYFWKEAYVIDVHCIQAVQEALAIAGRVRNPNPYQPRMIPPGPVPFCKPGILELPQQGFDVNFILRNGE
jgi:hypothetical protein